MASGTTCNIFGLDGNLIGQYSAAFGTACTAMVRPWCVMHRSGEAGAYARRDECELAPSKGAAMWQVETLPSLIKSAQ